MAENVYSEQFGPELTAEGIVEPILYYGDNLEILRRYIENESSDLVHLDPPFYDGITILTFLRFNNLEHN